MLCNALSRYTSSALRAPSPQGEGKVVVAPRGQLNERFLPRTRKFSPLCTLPLSVTAPGLPVLRGVSGGGAALSPGFQLNLCSLPKHGAHFAAQSPECAFLAKPFFAQAKNGVNLRRRSRKISVSEAKCYICRHKRAGALHLIRRRSPPPSPRRGRQREIVPRRFPRAGELTYSTSPAKQAAGISSPPPFPPAQWSCP